MVKYCAVPYRPWTGTRLRNSGGYVDRPAGLTGFVLLSNQLEDVLPYVNSGGAEMWQRQVKHFAATHQVIAIADHLDTDRVDL